MAPVSAGGYTLTDKNDTVYAFTHSLGSGAWGITSITDASGRALNFTWSSSSAGHIDACRLRARAYRAAGQWPASAGMISAA